MNAKAKAMRAAKRIPNGPATPEKRKRVHEWHAAVIQMLKGGK